MARSKYLNAPKGAVYGKWEVVDYDHYDNEHYWKVICLGCNNMFSRRAGQLVQGRSSGCQSCNSKEREQYSFWEGIDGISKQYITKLKHRQKEVDLTLQDIVDIWKQQNGKCAYSGLSLSLVQKDRKWAQSTASLDRIDSSKGYIKGNVQWVHKKVNTMKSDMTEEQFLLLCVIIAKHSGSDLGLANII